MLDHDSYDDPDTLKDFLAAKLKKGHLTVVLGAGASWGFGLPDWDKLTERLCHGIDPVVGATNEEKAEFLLTEHFGNDEIALARAVHVALYQDYEPSFEKFEKYKQLTSIAALVISATRGKTSRVISFNYDDILETYLGFYGQHVQSVYILPSWKTRADVVISHPHGFLPAKPNGLSSGVVLASSQYKRIVKDRDGWRRTLLETLGSSICLFIGLSGKDEHLKDLLDEAGGNHVATDCKYWGVRISVDDSDSQREIWEDRKVYHCVLPTRSYDELPAWLFDICQRASEIVP